MQSLARKCASVVVKGPATVRNVVFGSLGVWPTGYLTDPEVRQIPIYCISLRGADKRRRLIDAQIKRLGFSKFHLVDACESSQLCLDELIIQGLYDPDEAKRVHGRDLTVNEIACSLSHGRVYEQIVAKGHPIALIIEDDALFVTREMNRLRFDDIPLDFDLLFLNSFRTRRPMFRIRKNVYMGTDYRGSTAAYLISAKGAQKLARAYLPVVHAADGLLGRCMDVVPFSYLAFPDCVLNGSTCHFYESAVAIRN